MAHTCVLSFGLSLPALAIITDESCKLHSAHKLDATKALNACMHAHVSLMSQDPKGQPVLKALQCRQEVC